MIARLLRAVLTLSLVAFALGVPRVPASANTVWCPYGPVHGDGLSYENLEDGGWDYLCSGDYSRARTNFDSVLSHLHEFGTTESSYITVRRGNIFALMATFADHEARGAIGDFERIAGWHESDAERAFYDGKYGASFGEYLTQNALTNDRTLEAAQISMAAGDGATAAKLIAFERGNGAIYPLLLGDAYAVDHKWSQAIGQWIAAASSKPIPAAEGNVVPDPNSCAALERLARYYRQHANDP